MSQDPYDGIAKYYHLLFEDWDKAVEEEGRRLGLLFRPRGVRSVLDCTCGTGLQCLGLAGQGYEVTGCDSSPAMLRQARRNARQAGARVRWVPGDARSLRDVVPGPFDAVVSCGNSLSHFTSDDDLSLALGSMYAVLRPGGWCLVDVWDYEAMLRERPGGVYHRVTEVDGRRVVFYDTRSYGERTVTATFNLLLETKRGWRARQFVMELRPWRKGELMQFLTHAGFALVEDLSTGGKVELLGHRAGGRSAISRLSLRAKRSNLTPK